MMIVRRRGHALDFASNLNTLYFYWRYFDNILRYFLKMEITMIIENFLIIGHVPDPASSLDDLIQDWITQDSISPTTRSRIVRRKSQVAKDEIWKIADKRKLSRMIQ